jgi:formylglycine-generating enzyme required for sulfatase activity
MGNKKVWRGGSFLYDYRASRSAIRLGSSTIDYQFVLIGFRVVADPELLRKS